jgi:hypothetical protein
LEVDLLLNKNYLLLLLFLKVPLSIQSLWRDFSVVLGQRALKEFYHKTAVDLDLPAITDESWCLNH